MGRFLFPSRGGASDKTPSSTLSSSDSDQNSIDWISSFFHSEHHLHHEPQVITLTFHRESTKQRLGVKLGKRIIAASDDMENNDDLRADNESDVYVAALDKKHDSLLNNPVTLPIEVGDTVISFNNTLCAKTDLDTLQDIMSKTIGVITIRLVKNDGRDANNTSSTKNHSDIPENQETGPELMIVQQAIFVQPKEHTCLPMDLDFASQYVSQRRCLTIASINSFSQEEKNQKKNNNWLSWSCLEAGQIIIAINGSSSYNLEEDDARVFLQTKCELEQSVSITTLGFHTSTSHDPEVASTNNMGNSKNRDNLRIYGKENELSEASASARSRFPNIWNSSATNNGSPSFVKSTMWSLGGQHESEEDKQRKEQRKLDAQFIQVSKGRIQELIWDAKKDQTIDTAGKLPMLASCRKLFVQMKHRLDACSRERGTGEVYFKLYLSLSTDLLSQYAQVLQSILAAAAPSKTMSSSRLFTIAMRAGTSSSTTPLSSFSSLKGTERFFGYDKTTDDNERILCHIVNTSKFCADTIEQMEEMIRNTIDNPYATKIDMTVQQEVFDEISAKAMEFLVSLLSNRLQKSSFADMTKLSWKNWDHVQDTNDYVYSMCHQVELYLSIAEKLLSSAYFCSLCDKVAMKVIKTFDSIMLLKCNQTTTTGKQQLLLDVHTLKSFFLGKLVEDHKKGALVSSWAIYEKIVSEKFQKMEALLRIAAVSESDLKDNMDDII